jgi:PAS domain S-box-containing protein/diguanylate cyclase (GGDEF)-like protein
MRKSRILIVEDETIVALDLKSRLESMGYEVIDAVTTGERAIQVAGELLPDVVLMDVNLGGEIDGVQAAQEVKDKFQIPTIYVTACVDDTTIQRAKITEPFGYIIKPFEDRELRGHIEIALYKNQNEKKLRESEERYSLASKGANDGLWDWDLDRERIYFSPRWEALLGYEAGELDQVPREWFDRVHPKDRERLEKEIASFLKADGGNFQSEYRILHKDGNYRWMQTGGFGVRDSAGRAYRMAGSLTDITSRKLYDPASGLPNRMLFMDRLEKALDRAGRDSDYSFAVLVLKSVSITRVRDSLGYKIGDQLLSQFIERVNSFTSAKDTVVSLAEEGFAVLLEEIPTVEDASRVASRLQGVMAQLFRVGEHEIYAPVAVGIAVSQTGYTDAEDLLTDALNAVHRAGNNGNGLCEVSDPEMRSESLERVRLEAQLRQAIEKKEFVLFYQPIVSLADGRLVGFEALVRWQQSDGSLVVPDRFIPTLEETGLIIPLERWVLHAACAQLRKWQILSSNNLLTVNVNFSAEQYCQTDVLNVLEQTLKDTGISPETLKLEITERTFLQDASHLGELLAEIRKLRVQLHMDDFGTGYSSLSYLHRFPIDVLKIDRSFVHNLPLNSEAKQIIRTIVTLGQNLRMGVTAEGIENLDQLRRLQQLKCDFGQGFFFSRPINTRAASGLVLGQLEWLKDFEVSGAGRESKLIVPADSIQVARLTSPRTQAR